MCTTSCSIEVERAKESYRPGEVITGLVILDINCTNYVLLKALSLQISGYAHTKWKESAKIKKSSKPKPNSIIEYREDYVAATSYLIGSEMANAKRFEPGTYSFNFLVNLPQNIPSTFDSPFGIIRYELTVKADYGAYTKTLCNTPVIIEQLKDLRLAAPSLQLPAEVLQLEQKSCMKIWQQPLQLYVSVPQTAYIAGETISLHIKLTNDAKLKIQTITSNLNRMVTYKSLQEERISAEITEVTTIASNLHDLYGQSLRHNQLLLEIIVPQTPPTLACDECKCINITYELEVIVTGHNNKRWVRAIIPIVIGSISLRSDAKILPFQLNEQTVTAIRVAETMEDLALPAAMDLQSNVNAMQSRNISASMGSLASSFQEAKFMTPVQLNKKSKSQIVGDLHNFKPKYLYYDLPDEMPHMDQNDTSSAI